MRHHPDACQHLIEMLLGIKIEKMEIHGEETIELDVDSKGIRLDVFVKDTNQMFDVELQATDTMELPERSRYYQGMMDTDSLLKGEPYSKLKDSIIISLCRFDPFKKGISWYTVKRTCLQDSAVQVDDGALVHVFNCQAFAQVENPSLRAFLKYVQTGTAESDFTRRLNKMVETKKQIEGMKKTYLSWSLRDYDARMEARREGRNEGIAIGEKRGRSEGIAVGRTEGIAEKAREAARKLLAMHILTHEQIAQAEGLSVAEVEELAAQG
jgi:predicted transposase/invertase (TIGR01784 family)